MTRSLAATLATLLLSTACGRKESPPVSDANTVHDSAGVDIVDNHRAELTNSWHVDSTPLLTVSGHDPALLLNRVLSAVRLSDGRLAIVNGNPVRVLLIDRAGKLVRQFSRQGGGPGEFRQPEHLTLDQGDTLTIWDRDFGPGYRFDTTGRVVGETHTDLERFHAALGTGRVSESRLPFPGVGMIALVGERPQEKPHRDTPWHATWGSAQYLIVDSSYSTTSAGSYAHGLLAVRERVDGQEQVVFPCIFRWSYSATHDKQLYLSQADSYLIDVRDSTGRLIRSIRKTGDAVRMDDSLYQRMSTEVQRKIGNLSDADFRAGMSTLPDQHDFPPIMGLVVDAGTNLWVRESMSRWSVFGPEGKWLTSLELPLFKLLQVGKDFVVGLTVDPDGVESIAVLALRRAQS